MTLTLGGIPTIKPIKRSVAIKYTNKLYLRSCLRCFGDVELTYDNVVMDNVLSCLSCGFERVGKGNQR